MSVLLIAASPTQPSRSAALLDAVGQRLQARGAHTELLSLRELEPRALLLADTRYPDIAQAVAQVADAQVVVVATPVYKASFSGALKTVLDLLPERALAHKVVLPMATGGSIAHMLAVDYALKPVLSALKAQELLHGIFAEDSQIAYGEGSVQAQLVPVLEQRLHEALEQLYSAMARRPKPLDPDVLNERLLSARWSI